jgi:hypothetical protein
MNLNIFLGKLRVFHILLRMHSLHTCLKKLAALELIHMVSYQVSRTHIVVFVKNNVQYFETN